MSPEDGLTMWRICSFIVACACAFRMVMLIRSYIGVVMPIREKIREGTVLAPPAGWALSYHLFVLTLVLLVAERLIFGVITADLPPSFATFGWAPALIGLTMTAGRFQHYYTETLRAARSQEDRRAARN